MRDELLAHEGAGMTFYEFLGVPPTASLDDINKAYRKRSRLLHPDKVKQQLQAQRVQQAKQKSKEKGGKQPGTTVSKAPSTSEVKAAVKRASERQARLSIVANILRGPDRDRYDHFLSNGFPTWKGTEYYYSRYRPGLGTVLFGVFVVAGGGAHYVALYMGWRRQREFVERYIKFARHAAWGDNMVIPGLEGVGTPAAVAAPAAAQDEDDGRMMPTNRKMRRMQERETKKEASKTSARQARKVRRGGQAGSDTTTQTQSQREGSAPSGAKKRVVAENGKVLVVNSIGDVYLEQQDEDGHVAEFLLDVSVFSRLRALALAWTTLTSWAAKRALPPDLQRHGHRPPACLALPDHRWPCLVQADRRRRRSGRRGCA